MGAGYECWDMLHEPDAVGVSALDVKAQLLSPRRMDLAVVSGVRCSSWIIDLGANVFLVDDIER